MPIVQDIAVSNAMVSFLEPVVQNVLPNATATITVLDNFTVRLHAPSETTLLKHKHCPSTA